LHKRINYIGFFKFLRIKKQGKLFEEFLSKLRQFCPVRCYR